MNHSPPPSAVAEAGARTNRLTLWIALGFVVGVWLLVVAACGVAGFFVVRSVDRQFEKAVDGITQDLVRQEASRLEAESVGEREQRRQFVEQETARARSTRERFDRAMQINAKFAETEERLRGAGLSPPTGPSRSGFDRAMRENPESFAEEFRVTEEYLAGLAAAETLEECQTLAGEHLTRLIQLRSRRYDPELSALRADVQRQLAEVDEEAYCVLSVIPPMSKFGKALHDTAFAFDLVTALPLLTPFTVEGGVRFPISQAVREQYGTPRVAVVQGRNAAVEYLVQSVFAESQFEGASPPSCPWTLVAAPADEQEAREAAERAAEAWQAEQQAAVEAKQPRDPRRIAVQIVPPGLARVGDVR